MEEQNDCKEIDNKSGAKATSNESKLRYLSIFIDVLSFRWSTKTQKLLLSRKKVIVGMCNLWPEVEPS